MLTMHRLAKRGTWVPGRNSPAMFIVQLMLLFSSATRGLDFLRGGQDPMRDLTLEALIEAAPIDVWGAFLLSAVTVSVTGLVTGHGRLVASGHMMLMAGYAAIAFAMFQEIGFGPGVRFPISMTSGAIIHCAIGAEIFAIVRRRTILANTFHEAKLSRE